MCGIIGYSGPRAAGQVLIDSLRRLEYRGYDSAGVAILDAEAGGATTVVKSDQKVEQLAARLAAVGMPTGHTGIGHTRWATHGRPSVQNAHPHQDCTGRISVIHNGIIENFRELRAELVVTGHTFTSDTDTEVVPHLIEANYHGDLAAAVRAALVRIRGAYALVAVSADEPERIVGARLNAPLVVGLGDGEVFISSDITALIPYTKRVALLGEGEIVSATPTDVTATHLDGSRSEPRVIVVDWEAEQAQKDGYPHFFLKELHEQPDALRNALRGRIDDTGLVALTETGFDDSLVAGVKEIVLVACGSAWIAALATRYAIEQLAHVRCTAEPASEFRYSDTIVGPDTLVIAYSQSGETADTLAAVRHASSRQASVLGVTNVVGSALSMEADGVLYMQAGPEISVCATKSFAAQVACGMLIALHVADVRGTLAVDEHRRLVSELQRMPELVARAIDLEPHMVGIGQQYARSRNAMFIGRGINFPVALEGALKLKEVSYIHAEGYAAGELKHGPIALLDDAVPVIAIATRSSTLTKTISNVQEVRSRGAPVIALVTEGENPFDSEVASSVIELPACEELFSPLVNVVPLQLFAYHAAVERGCDVDQPRNLAKSVTVE